MSIGWSILEDNDMCVVSIAAGVDDPSDKASYINLFRRAIMDEVETFAIEYVVFNLNTSSLLPEIIALDMGLMPVVQEDQSNLDDLRVNFSFKGPGVFTTADIEKNNSILKFAQKTKIVELLENQSLDCDIILKKGNGKKHAKWRPVSNIGSALVDENYVFKFKNVGMMSTEKILTEGYKKIKDAANANPQTIFFKHLVPSFMEL